MEVGFSVTDKVISGVTWGLMQFPCNALIFGLVQFDRLGGDPLKRRVTDQVCQLMQSMFEFTFRFLIPIYLYHFQLFSNLLLNFIISNILRSVQTVQVIFDLDHIWFLNKFTLFTPTQSLLALQYTFIEIVLFKFWLRFIKKRLVPMDDNFIVTVLTMENITMSVLFGMAKVMISDDKLMPQYKSADSKL